MLLELWKNPEFIRHGRSELRPSRATAVGLVVLVVCVLTILACWASERARRTYTTESVVLVEPSGLSAAETRQTTQSKPGKIQDSPRETPADTVATNTSRNAFQGLMLMQFGVLTLWSLLSCAQAVARERERGTWDFQRTTRLTPSELLIGKLIGEPILAYFIVLCSFPVVLGVGLEGRIGILNILSAYFLLCASAVFIGLVGLWLSSLLESKSRGIGLIAAFAMYGVFLGSQGLTDSPFPGLAAFSPLTTLLPLIRRSFAVLRPTIFGGALPWLTMTLLLYLAFGAWLVLMLLRNLKRDFQEVRLLSRWQAVGCGAFLNFVLYALFNPMRAPQLQTASDFAMFMVAMNGFIFFFLGLTMLSSLERLEVGDFSSLRSIFSNHGLQWPWLLISAAVSYLLLTWGLFAWERALGFSGRTMETAAISLLIVLIFVTRDVLFIQWCKLTRLRAPLLKGVLFLALYYAAAGVVFGVLDVTSDRAATATANVLTPAAAFSQGSALLPVSGLCGIVVQLMTIAFLISSIRGRVLRTTLVAVAAAD